MKDTKIIKKRKLKKGVESFLTTIMGVWFFWVSTTVDTMDAPLKEIKSYLIITSILTIMALVSVVLITKYGTLFEEE